MTLDVTTGITADLDESSGLQLNDIISLSNPFGTAYGTPIQVALSGYSAQYTTGQTIFTTTDGLSASSFTLTADGSGTLFPSDPEGAFTPGTTSVDSGLKTADGDTIYLFATDDPLMVVGRTADGTIALAVTLELVVVDGEVTGGKLWTATYQPLEHAASDGGDPDGPLLTLTNKIYVGAISETSFDAEGVPSGQNLFIMFRGVENPDLGIVVTGKAPADGGNISSGDTVNTSQVTGTTFGVNNQMIDAGEGLWFTFIVNPEDNYTVPNLTQTEADVEANIQFTGSFGATSVEFDVVQLQGGKAATVTITAINSPNIGSGSTFLDRLADDTDKPNIVSITSVTVELAGGGEVTFTASGTKGDIQATFTDGTVTLAGLKAGDSITYTTADEHDRVLIENGATGKGPSSAAFDIGGFTITNTTDLSLEIGSKARFADDEPTATGTAVTFTVDEDGLTGGIAGGTDDASGTATIWTGSVSGIFQSGTDAPLTYGLVSTLPSLPSLTSGGVAVQYALSGNTLTAYVGTNTATNIVFTFSITDTSTGAASFTLGPKPLDHANTSGADENTENDITIDLGALVTATDDDGDSVTAAATKVQVTIDDDSPTATGTAVTFTVDEDGLTGGITGGNNDVAGTATTWTGSVAGIFQPGADGPLAYALVSTLPGTMPSLTSGGVTVQYALSGNTLTAFVGTNIPANVVFTFSITNTATGAASFTLGPKPLDHADTDDGENATDITFNLGALVTATDADGDTVTAAAEKLQVTVDDDSPTATGTAVTFTVDEDGLTGGIAGGNNDVAGTATTWTGSVAGIFQPGADGPLTYALVSTLPGTMPSLTSGGVTVQYALSGNTLTAFVGTNIPANVVFSFSITNTATGAASFTLGPKPLDHADTVANDENDLTIDLGALVTATDGDGDTVTAAAEKVRITVDDDTPTLTVGNLEGYGTPHAQVGKWAGAYGADGPDEMTLTLNSYTLGGVTQTAGLPLSLTGVKQGDGSYQFSGTIEEVPFTLTFKPDGTYVFDLDGSFESEATFSTANGSLPAGGPDPVQTLTVPSDEDPGRIESVVFFAVNPQANSGENNIGIADFLDRDEAYLQGPNGPSFIGSNWLMNVSTSGIGVGNNVLQGDRTDDYGKANFGTADESFVINPNSPVSEMSVYIDNSVGGYNTGRGEALYYRVYYTDGSVDDWTFVSTDPSVLKTEGQNKVFVIDGGDKLIDAVQFMMDKGDIKIPYITFKVPSETVFEPLSIDFTAGLTDEDGDTTTANFTVDLNTDPYPLASPGIVLTGVALEQDSFNIDLPEAIEPWVINGFRPADGDLLVVSAADFGGGLTAGTLDADYFVWGTAAGDAEDRFIYDGATGVLRFDADGTGTEEAAVIVGTLTGAPVIDETDFVVIA